MLLNILIGLSMVGITVIIQAFGTSFWIKHLINELSKIRGQISNIASMKLLVSTSIFLLVINTFQAIIWAVLYYNITDVSEIKTFEEAIYFSLITFTTLGYGDLTMSMDHRVLSGIEALNGILLIGWSTTLIYSTVQFVWKRNWKEANKKQ